MEQNQAISGTIILINNRPNKQNTITKYIIVKDQNNEKHTLYLTDENEFKSLKLYENYTFYITKQYINVSLNQPQAKITTPIQKIDYSLPQSEFAFQLDQWVKKNQK